MLDLSTVSAIQGITKFNMNYDFKKCKYTASYVQEMSGKRIHNKVLMADGIKQQTLTEVDMKNPAEYESQVIYLYTQMKYTEDQIADTLGISQPTVSKMLSQAGYSRR